MHATDLTAYDPTFGKLPAILVALLVYPLWIWLAVRTVDCLRFVTGHAVPFAKRTIWLVKILALIVGAGGVFGLALGLGLLWYFAVLPAGVVVLFALLEKTRNIVIPPPQQSPAAYHTAWEEYRRLRVNVWRSWFAAGIVFVTGIFISRFGEGLSKSGQIAGVAVAGMAILASLVMMYYAQWKLYHWRCPRCGCAFRGLLWPWPFLPKRCRYCELPRWQDTPSQPTPSTKRLA